MTLFLASVTLGMIPMVIYALIVWRLDRWEKEPFPLILAAFTWGAVPSVIFAVVAQHIFGVSPNSDGSELSLMSQLYEASFLAPFTEELVKGVGVYLIFLLFRREIDSVLDGLIYGSMVGFGFAAVENVFYFIDQPDAASLIILFFFRAFIFGMIHALFTGLTGVGLALGMFSRHLILKLFWPVAGLGMAMFCHAVHNYFATLGGTNIFFAMGGVGVGLLWFTLTVTICLYHEHRWIRIHLSEEVEEGVLFAEQALDAAAYWSRSIFGGFSKGFRMLWKRQALLNAATKLAYLKHKATRFQRDPSYPIRIAALRERVRLLSRQDPLVLSGRIRPGLRLPPPLPPTRRMPPPLSSTRKSPPALPDHGTLPPPLHQKRTPPPLPQSEDGGTQ